MTQAPIYLTILRRDDTIIVDLAEVGSLIPRSETRVDDAFLREVSAELTSLALPGAGREESGAVVHALQRMGSVIFSQLLTEPARRRLRLAEPCELYLRLDEQLLHLPWELCYDGEQFLATKFRLGRQVITSYPLPATVTAHRGLGPLRVLLIADPTETLPQASQEVERLCELLGGLREVEVTLVGGSEVRKVPLLAALQAHDIVHFAGHNRYDAQTPSHSGWVLHEGLLTAAELSKLGRPPLLVFSNSCEAGATAAWEGGVRYEGQAFGLGSAFLLAGVQNYVGTLWMVSDEESTLFATAFYRSVTTGQSVGEALFQARHARRSERGGGELTWASYVLYGDPAYTMLPTINDQPLPIASIAQSLRPVTVVRAEGERKVAPQHTVRNSLVIGRGKEVEQLRQWLERAQGGERQVVFVTGEPGIGKTMLVETFLGQLNSNEQLRIGRGQCIEHYGAGEAYLPVLEALGRLCREAEGEAVIRLLRQHAPSWMVQMPALLRPPELEELQRRTAGVTRERMLRELAEALEVLTTETPLVLVLEDLHWSDVSTLDLLSMLARRQEAARLLIIGTYRPVEVLTRDHPLKGITQELQVHGQCQELTLAFLMEGEIAEYLTKRFNMVGAQVEQVQQLARMLHRRTEGSPLFMVTVVNALVAQGVIVQTTGGWEIRSEVKEQLLETPVNLRQMIERQVERVSPEERQLLEAASVTGAEFSAAAVAAGVEYSVEAVEEQCEAMVRREQFLRPRGVTEWPDGTIAARYGFVHALYQEVLYEQLSVSRRSRLHRQIGEREEQGYGERAREIAAELAVHFEQGRDYARAVRYRQYAGETAMQRNAYQETVNHLSRGLELLKTLPDTPERARQELTLQLALGPPLLATKGYAAPEMEHTYNRARELCQQVGETAQLFPVLNGLWTFSVMRAEYRKAQELAEQLLSLAQSAKALDLLVEAHWAVGYTTYQVGGFPIAREHFEQSLAFYDPQEHSALSSIYGQDPGVTCLSYMAWTLWQLGYPEQAMKKMDEALRFAEGLSQPFSLVFAIIFMSFLRRYRREWQSTQEWAEKAIAISLKQGFPHWVQYGSMARGWALAQQGQAEQGVLDIIHQLADQRTAGAQAGQALFLSWLAEAYEKAGCIDDGLGVLVEALTFAEKTGERCTQAELYRLKGELLLLSRIQRLASTVQKEAEECFCQAIDIARSQSAKSWELRAVTSLSRLWQQQGKKDEAHKMLTEIYNWFREGFDTADLKDAKALLDALRH